MPPASSPASIESLPDALLGEIFAAAGRQAGPAVTLVSRRWHRVFFTEPALWRELAINVPSLNATAAEEWFQSRACLLRRVGGFVERFRYSQFLEYGLEDMPGGQHPAAASASGTTGWQLGGRVLEHLCPDTLRSLCSTGEWLDAAPAQVLQRFSGLTHLSVYGDGPLPRGALAALPGLPHLQSVALDGSLFPEGLAGALRQLEQLTALSCTSRSPLPDLSAVLPLSQLRKLYWDEAREDGVLRADLQQLFARLPHLEEWTLCSQLRHFNVSRGGSLQVGGAIMERCSADGCSPTDGTVASMALWRIQNMPSLQQLLAAALPAGVQRSVLRRLVILDSRLTEAAVASCALLCHLTSLTLTSCTFPDGIFPDGSPAPVIEELVEQAPELQRLNLHRCLSRNAFPRVLLRHTDLPHLSLQGNGLSALPDGPYLATLESLNLANNLFHELPPVLAVATSLTELSLEGNAQLALSIADADLLLRLPSLRRLSLNRTSTPQYVLRWLHHLCT